MVREELVRLLFVILEAAISVLLPILILYGINAIRDANMRRYAEIVVRYAQERIPENSARYSYVAAALARRYKFLNERDVAHLIESSVNAIKRVQIGPTNVDASTHVEVKPEGAVTVTPETGASVKIDATPPDSI